MDVGDISSLSILVPFSLGLISYARLDYFQKVFWYFIGFTAAFEGLVFYFVTRQWNTFGLFDVFLLIDLLFFAWLFYKHLAFPRWLIYLTLFITLFTVVTGTALIFTHMSTKIQLLYYMVLFFFFLIQSGFVIISMADQVDINPVKHYLFWLAFARLFYFLIVIFIYAYSYLDPDSYENKSYAVAFGIINSAGNIICNSMYGVALVCRKV